VLPLYFFGSKVFGSYRQKERTVLYYPLEVEKGFSLSKEIFHNEKKQIDILRL
jgi:hypothetical protein